MLSRDVLILHLLSLFLRRGKYLRQARTEILLAPLHARETRNGRLAVAQHHLHVRAELAQHRTHYSLGLLEHCAENVLWLDLLILVLFSEFYARLDGFLSSKCELV